MDLGILLLRLVIGGLFIGHGGKKLFGWFDGPGPESTTGFFGSLGYRRPRTMAWVGAGAELGGGALLVLGFLTPLATAALIGVMVNAAIVVHAENGLWNADGGFELPLVLGTSAGALAFTGAGAWSLDNAFGWTFSGIGWGFFALSLGLMAAAAVLTMRETAPVSVRSAHAGVQLRDERQAA